MYHYKDKLTNNAQTLRKNMTKEEKRLWYDFLKKLPLSVHRQKTIESYIVDFYIASHQIVIELDGSQHGEPENREADIIRDKALGELGMRVLRYTNGQIKKNFRGVCLDILKNLGIEEKDVEW
jgi:very-short-patch-repair endonuclease